MGGMVCILQLMCSHDNDDVRKNACKIFQGINANNIKVQAFAGKAKAINICHQLELEKKPEMREAVLGCLSSWLKAANFDAKRVYISECDGLQQLQRWLSLDGPEATKVFGEKPPMIRKIKIKLLQLAYDLALNDDSILD